MQHIPREDSSQRRSLGGKVRRSSISTRLRSGRPPASARVTIRNRPEVGGAAGAAGGGAAAAAAAAAAASMSSLENWLVHSYRMVVLGR